LGIEAVMNDKGSHQLLRDQEIKRDCGRHRVLIFVIVLRDSSVVGGANSFRMTEGVSGWLENR
jgi:hypothetical protein